MIRETWKKRCRAGLHRWRGREHYGGCPLEGTSHWHVRCRRPACDLWWVEPTLFDPRPFGIAT
jgi:hypothetical protein